MDAGELIRNARERAGLTQAELAARSGTTQSAVSRWERSRVEPGFDTLRRLIAACGFDSALVIEGTAGEPEGFEGNLRLRPEERLDQLVRTVRFIQAGRASMRGVRGS